MAAVAVANADCATARRLLEKALRLLEGGVGVKRGLRIVEGDAS